MSMLEDFFDTIELLKTCNPKDYNFLMDILRYLKNELIKLDISDRFNSNIERHYIRVIEDREGY